MIFSRAFAACLQLLVFFTCCAAAARAEPLPSFDSANLLYEQGDYRGAAAAYQQLIDSGKRSAAIYFNLGNAWFKSGQLGKAIVAYRKASRLAPRDPDIRANLQFARSHRTGPTLAPGTLERWMGRLTVNEWTLLASVAFWGCLGALFVWQLRPDWQSTLRKPTWALLCLTILLAVCLTLAWKTTQSRHLAVVVAPEAPVRHGPLEESQAAFTAYDGAELEILDRKDQWVQVTAGTRHIGWVRQEHIHSL